MARLTTLPFIVLLMGLGALMMLVPAVYGWVVRDLETARAFLYFAYPAQISGDAVWVAVDGHTGATILSVVASDGMDADERRY